MTPGRLTLAVTVAAILATSCSSTTPDARPAGVPLAATGGQQPLQLADPPAEGHPEQPPPAAVGAPEPRGATGTPAGDAVRQPPDSAASGRAASRRARPATHATPGCDRHCRQELARARAATEKYWDVSVAISDGYVEQPGCVTSPVGAVGVVYADVASASDPGVNVERPSALLYMLEGVGEARRLVAAQYSVPILDEDQQPPVLFGRRFDGPVASAVPGLREYRLRVWLFSDNPDGLFAVANPAEACTGSDLVVPHGSARDCHEVHSYFGLPAHHVRAVGGVPEEFTLATDGNGNAEVAFRTLHCDQYIVAGSAAQEPVKFTLLDVGVLPPDRAGDSADTSRYLLRVVVTSPEFARWWRNHTGASPEAITHRTDLHREFTPIVGLTDLGYRFASPDGVVECMVADPAPPAPAHLLPIGAGFWFETPRGMGQGRLWLYTFRLGAAQTTVAPTPGSLLAQLIGCTPDLVSGSCAAVPADRGNVAAWDENALTATVSRQWWNPRHDVGIGSAPLDLLGALEGP